MKIYIQLISTHKIRKPWPHTSRSPHMLQRMGLQCGRYLNCGCSREIHDAKGQDCTLTPV